MGYQVGISVPWATHNACFELEVRNVGEPVRARLPAFIIIIVIIMIIVI